MTKKDYIRIGNVLAWNYDSAVSMGVQKGVARVIRSMIQALQEDNPRFDKDKFITFIEHRSCYNHAISSMVLDAQETTGTTV